MTSPLKWYWINPLANYTPVSYDTKHEHAQYRYLIKVPEAKARAAAESLSKGNDRILRLEQKVELMKRDIIITILGANGLLFGLIKYLN